jgi:NHL repeat
VSTQPLKKLLLVGVLVMAGCSNANTQTTLPTQPASVLREGKSWVSPAAKGSSLLYVSDAETNEVYIYTYPAAALVGSIAGFKNPHGLCSDSAGNVYVTDTGNSKIESFPHGSVIPTKSFADKNQYPVGCTIGSKQNTFFVSNSGDIKGGPGSVTVYEGDSHGSYQLPNIVTAAYITHDGRGDLYVDGTDASGDFELDELVEGQPQFKPATLNQHIGRPGGVEADGKYIAIGDESTNTVYLTSGTSVVGTIVLNGASEVVQFTIDGNTLIGPDDGNATIGFWPLQGGPPSQVISGSYLSKPTGSTISAK